MKTLQLVQGSPEWVAARSRYFCASEAAAMLGLDPKLTRNELIRMKATGDQREFSDWVRDNLLDKGHEIEAEVRADMEAGGTTYYPVTGVEGRFLASFDGIDLDDTGTHGLEVKSWNAALAAAVEADEVPDSHWPQLEQQIFVGGLENVLFVVSDGERRTKTLFYTSKPERLARLKAGWLQFAEDVANYQHQEYIPAAKATATEDLPVPFANTVGGAAIVKHNLPIVRDAVTAFVERIPAKPESDQEFADCASAVKKLEGVEQALIAAKTALIEQSGGVALAVKLIDQIRDIASTARLATDKLVKRRKEDIRAEQVTRGQRLLAAHVKGLNDNLPSPLMPAIVADFPGAIARLKNIDTLRNGIDTHLADKKIEASAIAETIRLNLKALAELGADLPLPSLFPDLRGIAIKPADDFRNLVTSRIADFRAAEAAKAEALREKIAAEERAKLERAQAAEREAAAAKANPAVVPGLSIPPAANAAPIAPTGLWKESRDLASVAPKRRPTDEEIVRLLAASCFVDERLALQWLSEGQWQAMRQQAA